MVAAGYMCYCKNTFTNIEQAYEEYCKSQMIDSKALLFPSQKRYQHYIGDILNGFISIFILCKWIAQIQSNNSGESDN